MLATVDVADGRDLPLHLGSKGAVVVRHALGNGLGGLAAAVSGCGEGDEAGIKIGRAIEGVVPGLPGWRVRANRLSARGVPSSSTALFVTRFCE